jgi:subtilisin-like proprotein convertase family protein
VGYTTQISANIPYESTAFGVYDGLFHDHGEDEDLWYVTQDAVIFCGNLAVQESGSGLTSYYWNIYNLMGDPSISPYLGIPAVNPVTHAPNLVANETSATIGAAVGSYVGITQAGVLLGAGTVHQGETEVTIDFLQPLTAGVPAKIVVMGQNLEPYTVELPVAAPSVVQISPLTVPAMTPTAVSIQVYENDGTTPISGVTVQLQDAMEYAISAVTDAAGQATLMVEYPYGCPLDLAGSHPEAGFMFAETLTVTGTPLASPDLAVATEYGLEDVFAMNLESTLTATTGTPGTTLVAYVPGLGRLESTTGSLVCTPTAGGDVTAYVLRDGYEVYSETFTVLTQGSLRGTVSLEGETDWSGVAITAEPGGQTTTTAADGSYLLTGLDAGTYTVTAALDGFSVGQSQISVAEGEHLGDIDFALAIVYEVEECVQPNLAIPDNNATGVTSSLTVATGGEITWARVYIDLTHTYIGDLRVRLTSPAGTSIMLHDRSGSSSDDILGWYPDDLTPAGDLAAFLGEDMAGTWTLTVSDHAGWDTGTLVEWCLNLGFAGSPPTGVEDLPAVLALGKNYPNPFNPQTTIGFALPRAGEVRLAVFDVRGRLVSQLVSGELAAGRHEVTWRGTDDQGRRMASGTYVYRLQADGVTISEKMLLVK